MPSDKPTLTAEPIDQRLNERLNQHLATAGPRVTIPGDVPLSKDTPHLDGFSLHRRLALAYDVLRHPKTPLPAAIAITGGWGSGKTSAMRWLQGQLKIWNEHGQPLKGQDKVRVHSVWFDPWKYHEKEDVWRGLIAEVILASVNVEGATVARVQDAAKRFGGFLGRSFLSALARTKLSVGVKGGPEAEITGEVFSDIYDQYQKVNRPERPFLNEFEETLKTWVKNTIGHHERLVIFIDDLDRCMPNVALEVLEALKLYLDIPRLIFVLGVDRTVVDDIVEEYYKKLGLNPVKSKKYLDKMFQLEVVLDPSEQQIDGYLDGQLDAIPLWNEQEHLKPEQRKLFARVLSSLVDRNPRQVKRLLCGALSLAAGAVLHSDHEQDAGERLTFAQGFQVFLVRQILRDRYGITTMVGSRRGDAFLDNWSLIARSLAQDQTASITVPKSFLDSLDDQADQPAIHPSEKDNFAKWGFRDESPPVDLSFSSEEFHELLRRNEYRSYFHLLADPQLGQLMRVEYPNSQQLSSVVESVSITDLIRERVAKKLNKKPQEITQDDLNTIKSLDLSESDIIDVTPLATLTNLQWLYLNQTSVIDVTPLATLTNLQTLYLNQTSVSDVTPLATLTNLQQLYLNQTSVSDVTPLATLTNLEWLGLNQTSVSDVTPLATLANLQWLYLNQTSVSDVTPLATLTNLQELYLNQTSVSDVTPLATLTNLQELYLNQTSVSDVTPLATLTNLQELYLNQTSVSDVTPLATLTNLQELYLIQTSVSDVTPLATLTNLQELYLNQTSVSDVTPLATLTNLQILNLNQTSVSDVTPLATLTNLQILYLNQISVSDVTPLATLTNLQWLYLNQTSVSNVTPLATLTNLQRLNLNQTSVSDVQVAALKRKMPRLTVYR